jgi:hypothetical protein
MAELGRIKISSRQALPDAVILSLGNNVVDLYIGKLNMKNISDEITQILQKENHLQYADFTSWLAGSEFKKVTLSDNSVWVLRKGFIKEQYIHIHPGKHSPNTFRTNSNALKTAYTIYYTGNSEKPSLEIINKLRKEKLKLSPVRTVEELNKCKVLLKLFRKSP